MPRKNTRASTASTGAAPPAGRTSAATTSRVSPVRTEVFLPQRSARMAVVHEPASSTTAAITDTTPMAAREKPNSSSSQAP